MGEVWFGEDAVDKMVDWTEKHYLPIAKDLESESSFIMDLGCGNGHLLLKLKEELGLSQLLGVDYSPQAVELARQVAIDQGITEITYKEMDILSEDSLSPFRGRVSLALDKGTLDAISLAAPSDLGLDTLQDVQNAYASAVHSLLQDTPKKGMLLITSCNWTEDELMDIFTRNSLFSFHSRVKYPSYKFGGQTGQTIATLAFTKK